MSVALSALLDAARPRLRPAAWHALRDVTAALGGGFPLAHGSPWWWRFARAERRFVEAWATVPELVAVGRALLAPRNDPRVRAAGLDWLARLPSREMVETAAAIAKDRDEPHAVRERAVAALGHRRLAAPGDAQWPNDAIAAADAALLALFRARGDEPEPLRELPIALRHVADLVVLDEVAEDAVAATPALEAYASTELARRLVPLLPSIRNEDAMR
ncbi:MAG TPA: hypothetical protein VHB21_03955, partial [Minicystis sp.]|nr:hypothetical protein [Minicystis sp.]